MSISSNIKRRLKGLEEIVSNSVARFVSPRAVMIGLLGVYVFTQGCMSLGKDYNTDHKGRTEIATQGENNGIEKQTYDPELLKKLLKEIKEIRAKLKVSEEKTKSSLDVNDAKDFKEPTKANKLLKEFPNQISGASVIEKYAVPGAKYCLVHIKQRHIDSLGITGVLSYFQSPEALDKINECQKNIYSILTYLIRRQKLKGVYDEGQTKESVNLLKNDREKLEYFLECPNLYAKRLARKKRRLEFLLNNNILREFKRVEELKEEYKKILKEWREFQDKYGCVRGSALRLLYQGKIDIYSAETQKTLDKAISEFKKNRKISGSVSNEREDTLLGFMHTRNEVLAVTVFGGDHDFKDNIAEWNRTNPNEKFSLIEIAPIHYQK